MVSETVSDVSVFSITSVSHPFLNSNLILGFCWNSALASCAVAASDEVREAVTASRTAQRAKNIAEEAAKNAEASCNSTSFVSVDEKMQAMTQASNLRSQAIYAAVVDHEALTAKRRAAVALARDVKCWNVHRKQELIKTCLQTVRSYQKIAHDSMCTWTQLKQSLLESQSVSNIVQSRTVKQSNSQIPSQKEHECEPKSSKYIVCENEDPIEPTDGIDVVSATVTQSDSLTYLQAEVTASSQYDNVNLTNQISHDDLDLNFSLASDLALSMKSVDAISSSFVQDNSAIILQSDAVENCQYDNGISPERVESDADLEDHSHHSHFSNHFDIESSFHDTFQEKIPSEGDSFPEKMPSVGDFTTSEKVHEELKHSDIPTNLEENSENLMNDGDVDHQGNSNGCEECHFDLNSNSENIASNLEEGEDSADNGMTESMQSLVDGLMNWGGQWDEEEDIAPLPHGVAASLLEGSGMLNSQ